MQVDPLTYRKMLILIYMIPALVLVMAGVTYLTTNNITYNSMIVTLGDGSEKVIMETEAEFSKHRMNALVLIIVGFLISFILVGKNKKELKELKEIGKESSKE